MDARADYLAINQANWDARVPVHLDDGYGIEHLLSAPDALSPVVAFDRARLGDLDGLDVVHLQCHIGTDTLSLARLGAASVTGVDLSQASLRAAADLATRAGASIGYVQSDVYSAPDKLGRRTFDLVYTGIGALCWLPDIARWARTVAELLRPGGRVFVRDCHPMLGTMTRVVLRDDPEDRAAQPWMTSAGGATAAVEFPYYEQRDPLEWHESVSYAGSLPVVSPHCVEWNHGLAEIAMAVLDAGLRLDLLVEHDSVPWNALPGLMVEGPANEFRLAERPERLAASFTLVATKPVQSD